MPVTESKLKSGELTLDPDGAGVGAPVSFACQMTSVSVEPSYDESGDDVEVLCGDVLSSDVTRSDRLVFTAIQDFADPAGLTSFSWEHDLEVVPFVWRPQGTGSGLLEYAGTVEVRALKVGGDVNRRLTHDAEWRVQGKATRTVQPA